MAKQSNTINDVLVPGGVLTALGYYLVSRYGDAVTKSDLAFSVGFLVYLALANAFCFDSNRLQIAQRAKAKIDFEPMGKHSLGKGQFITRTSFIVYFAASKILGFLIPLFVVVAGPKDLAVMMTPSLVVVIAQAIAEPATASFHDVPRILVPIGYCTYRLFGPLATWATDAYNVWDADPNNTNLFNLVLAGSDLVFCAWNLFGFLLLRVVPLYFDQTDSPTPEFAYTLLPLPKKKHL